MLSCALGFGLLLRDEMGLAPLTRVWRQPTRGLHSGCSHLASWCYRATDREAGGGELVVRPCIWW